jgi:lysophospholipase L1-like esterase
VLRRFVRATLVVVAGILLGISCYAGLVKVGLARNPFAPVAGGDLQLARSGRSGVRVLFVGNSLTFKNDLPELVHRLGGRRSPIFAGSYTAPGWQLRQFAHNDGLERLLHEVRWDVVVLQEQSQIPSFPADDRAREFTPYVVRLADEVRRAGAQPLLFVTWAHRTGDRRNVHDDTYSAMQQRVVAGYADAARAAQAAIAPVGPRWAEALRRRPQLELWASDGTHPSRAGSYLAGCVFYGLLTRRSPVGDAYTAALDPPLARFLQRVSLTG